MLYSISNTTQKNKDPLMRSEIKAYGSVGKPFCVQLDSEPQAWWLVPDGCDNGISLPLEYLGSDGDKYFYNGNVDLISYLEGEGYSIPKGRYKFKINGGGYVEYIITGLFEAYTDMTNAYGVYEFGFITDSGISVGFISNSNEGLSGTDNYSLYSDGEGDIQIFKESTTTLSTQIFSAENQYIVGDKYYIKIERNETVDQYHIGSIGSMAIYGKSSINDDYGLIISYTGSNPIEDNEITSSLFFYVKTQNQKSSFIHPSVNGEYLDLTNFTTTSGNYVLSYNVTGGTNKYTDLFILDSSEPVTDGIGEFSDDYSNDYAI